MRQYAAKHAQSWYKYVNGTRGRGLVNGNLYLVTGCEKPRSWGMAFFHDVPLQNEFQLWFKPIADADNGYRYRWQGIHCCHKQADPPVDAPLNQTTFIHAFAISVGQGIWKKLFPAEVCQLVDSSMFLDKPRGSFVPYRPPLSSFLWSRCFENRRRTQRTPALAAYDESVPLLCAPQLVGSCPVERSSKIIHPSEIIHEHILREVPGATVVITHDDDWCNVFKDDDVQTSRQTASELQRAIFDHSEILDEDGAAFLRAKSDPATSRDAATMTGEKLRPIQTLLELSAELGLANDSKLRMALHRDGERIATLLRSIFVSKSLEEAVLRLEGDSAQCFLDVVQSTTIKIVSL
ncbi:WD40-containing domain protein [Mycena sanguinolenta]|uniref:WD40-containing domain protein n=1 Tax=Mycena sanguinolenta TaxID=230812 RepID=A0A8H6Z8V5_9AGAR|nr:WD40-containing domain protein [Mycena sanguinolenta]